MLALLCLGAVPASRAALVDLDIFVTFGILKDDAVNYLVDGSVVVVVGSGDDINNGMVQYGGTNYVAQSVQGDDIILGTVLIGDNVDANTGKFFTTIQYNSVTSQIGYVYIRYFQTNAPVVGMVHWGASVVTNLIPTNFGGVVTIAADPSQLVANNYNNFIVIPEPATGQLVFITGGLLLALRLSRARRQRKGRPGPPLRRP